MTNSRKLILYIATSLDGYIAQPNDDLSFLDSVQKEGEDYGYNDFILTVDTVILGRKTYDWVMNHVPEFPHADKETFVITRKQKAQLGKIVFYTGNIRNLVLLLKKKDGKNIFCDGGAEVVNVLLKEKLIDELIISVIPVLVGDGIKLFQDDRPEQNLELISAKKFDTGLVQLHYKVISD
jgi:dihydrofolate reductase